MKNARPSRRERSAWGLFLGTWAALLLGACTQADSNHWLTPSYHAVERGSLSASGVVAAGPTAPPAADRAQLVREGATLYATHCQSCHGQNLAGGQGAPPLLDAGGAVVDFYLTTGRMPLAVRSAVNGNVDQMVAQGTQQYHQPSLFTPDQIAALDAFVDAHAIGSVAAPAVRLDPALLQHGRELFEDNCQSCHGPAAQGATAGYQWTAVALGKASPREIGEAIRIGPGVMPKFDGRALTDRDVDAIATYVRYLATDPQRYGGTTMAYLGPLSEGAVGAFIGVGFLFWVIYFTGTKADGRRVNEWE